MIARVVVDTALDRLFDYRVPTELADRVDVGACVKVQFGRRGARAYVIEMAEHSAFPRLKSILSIEGELAPLLPELVKLARWMADYYCAPVEHAIRSILPAAVRREGARAREKLYVAAAEGVDLKGVTLTKRQREVAEQIAAGGDGFLAELTRRLKVTPGVVRKLADAGVVTIEARTVRRDPLANRRILPTTPLDLMSEQAECLAQIVAACRETTPKPVLLHGVTGSGKTEVYLQAIATLLDEGGGAIVLVPEIALTPQTVQRFVSRFGQRVAVLHSALSDGERYDEWHRIRGGDARVVVGPRSAVFAPVEGLRLIVVDEEHEPSYKQDESPRYNARDVAVMRGHLSGCAVVLGTATPSLESWANVRKGKYTPASMPRRVDDRQLPAMYIIDMRVEADRNGFRSVFSQRLIDAVQERLRQGEQTILFLNRRGYASSLICRSCGYVAECNDCSVAYTYHRADECLRCHICGAYASVPTTCPGCGDPGIRYAGFGTQRVELIAQKCFPKANIQRMDADVTARKHSHEEILGAFRAGHTDILIGTQMIAKGLDFPNVTLVGVLMADLSLHMPDFRAAERTFQLLAQVSGRAGRGEVPGEVVVQTYTPGHESIQAAKDADFEGFADLELEERQELMYPPFSHLVCVTLRGVSEDRVAFVCGALARELEQRVRPDVRVSPPVPAPLARAKGEYRYQLLLRHPSPSAMTRPLLAALSALSLPDDVRCAVDVDAMSIG